MQTYPYFRSLYVISVRRTKNLPTASFRFHLTMDTLAVQLYTSSLPRRVRDLHPLERAHGAQTKGAFRLFPKHSLGICGFTLILLDFEIKIALWCIMMYHCKKFCCTFVGLLIFLLHQKSMSYSIILVRILNDQSLSNTRFLSIISSILSIYWATSFTFSHRSIRPSGYTRFVIEPAPNATMVCTSSIIKML